MKTRCSRSLRAGIWASLALARLWVGGMAAGVLAALLLAATLALAPPHAWANPAAPAASPAPVTIRITDDLGHIQQFNQSPQRIVSLLPSLTETVCALGACHRLVGVDDYSNWPAEVQRLPRLGGGIDASPERVLALRPDVVLVASSSRALSRLQALGLKVLALEPKTPAEAERVFLQVAALLSIPQADAAARWQAMDAEVAATTQAWLATRAPGAAPVRVYFEVNSAPYAAAPSSFIGQMLARFGVENIVPDGLGPFPRINPEMVVRAQPDVIMVSDRHPQGLAQRPGWSSIPAVRQQRLCLFTPEQGDVLVRPGPRMAEAARLLANCLKAQVP